MYRKNGVTRIVRGNYLGGRYSKEWKTMQERVFQRDGGCCVKCGRSKQELSNLGISMNRDHIRRISRGGTDTYSNLRLVCEDCHSKQIGHNKMYRKMHGRK